MTYMPCLKLQLDDDLKQALVGDEVAMPMAVAIIWVCS
jgi:hypothetical protein